MDFSKRLQFRNRAIEFMNHYGLSDWSFEWSNAHKILGECNFKHRTLKFSTKWVDVNTIEVMEDTILHEIAHALAGPYAKHGFLWQNIAKKIGATPRACATDKRLVFPSGPYIFDCRNPNCDIKQYFFQARTLGRVAVCKKCNTRNYITKNLEYFNE
jgi:predicted SprT family Zn-dependent metalloprotease